MGFWLCLATTLLCSNLFAKDQKSTERSRSLNHGRVSVNELRTPPKANKELGLFQEDFESGKLGDAAQHLHNAIQIYPENPVAHHNLGICYVRLKEYEKAVAEFEAASALDPRLVQPIISLSGAFFLLGRYPDAEAAARHALDIDPVNTLARYLLGRTLALEGRDTQETVQLLRASSSRFPLARLALVSILVKHNAREEAVAELREYLRQPDAPDKDKVTRMLERLAQPPETSKSPLE